MKASINKDRGVCCFVKMECVHLSMCIECISDKTDAIGVCLKGLESYAWEENHEKP